MSGRFNNRPELSDRHFTLRPLREDNREALAAAAADPGIWAGHPVKDRFKRDVFDPYFDFLLSAGGALAIREAETDRVVGCSRFYSSSDILGCVAIGFTFLTRDHWGGDANRRVKRMMLNHAFSDFDAVWFHIAPDNLRSRKATEKLGAALVDIGSFRLTNETAEWARYRLTREVWEARETWAARSGARAPKDGGRR